MLFDQQNWQNPSRVSTRSGGPYVPRSNLALNHGTLKAVAKRTTIEINPATTRVSRLVDIKLSMRAAEAMDAIWTRYQTQVK